MQYNIQIQALLESKLLGVKLNSKKFNFLTEINVINLWYVTECETISQSSESFFSREKRV